MKTLSPQDTPTPPSSRRTLSPEARNALNIALIVFLAAIYFIPRGEMWNADTRLFLTASIVDRGSLDIDPYQSNTQDKALYKGHYYSDKAPGLSVLAVPVYAGLKAIFRTDYATMLAKPPDKRLDFVFRYLITVVLIAVPAALLAALFYLFLARFALGTGDRVLLSLGYSLGTIAFPFSTVFLSHQCAAVLLFGSFLLLYRLRQGRISGFAADRCAAFAGLLAGYAVISEYPTFLIATALGLYLAQQVWLTRSWRWLVAFASGALPPVLLAATYNTLVFGSPWSQGYAHLGGLPEFQAGQSQGLAGITFPHPLAIWQTTFGPYRGLFLLSPFLVLALPGFRALFRRREWRAESWLWLGIVAVYALFTVSYFEWSGGASIGPRHFIPALPFLVLPVAALVAGGTNTPPVRPWVRFLTRALIPLSILIVVLGTATYPLVDSRFDNPLVQWTLPLLLGLSPDPTHPALPALTLWNAFIQSIPFFPHARLDNNWGMLFGLPGIFQLLPLGLLCGYNLFAIARRTHLPRRRSLVSLWKRW